MVPVLKLLRLPDPPNHPKPQVSQGPIRQKVMSREFMREHGGGGGQEDVGEREAAPQRNTGLLVLHRSGVGWCSRAPHGTIPGGWHKPKGFPTTPHSLPQP